jgi:hypothetical protein
MQSRQTPMKRMRRRFMGDELVGHTTTAKHLGFHARDEAGLERAYDSKDKTYVDGDTEYIAGTDPTNPRDLWDDLKIPFGLMKYSHRYKQAENTLKENPQVSHLVGHSMGEAVGEEMEKTNDRDLSLVGYGAPVISKPGANETDYRHGGDPISMFDRGAKTIGGSINPIEAHSYTGYTTGFSDADNKEDASP